MEKVIILKDSRARKNIEKAFGVTAPALSQSFTFSRNGEKNRKIRLVAMRSGGKLLIEQKDWDINHLK